MVLLGSDACVRSLPRGSGEAAAVDLSRLAVEMNFDESLHFLAESCAQEVRQLSSLPPDVMFSAKLYFLSACRCHQSRSLKSLSAWLNYGKWFVIGFLTVRIDCT